MHEEPVQIVPTRMNQYSHFAFVSANVGGGGSEELWVQTAAHMASRGVRTTALTTWSDRAAHRLEQLSAGQVPHIAIKSGLIGKLVGRLKPSAPPEAAKLRDWLKRSAPTAVVFNSGTAFDGLDLLRVIADSGIPHCIVTHLVSEANWPDDKTAERAAKLFAGASRTCFVSEHNRELFEVQCACRLPEAEIVRNPYLVAASDPLPWPTDARGVFRMAFPARLYPRTKGHDMLVRVMAQPKWRDRSLQIDLFGKGPAEKTLRRHVELEGVENIHFRGHTADVPGIWRESHALILPSRHEGLPICLVEAMMAGRPAFINPAGGSPEVMTEGETGLISSACTVEALDRMLEEAWTLRDSWKTMGEAAAKKARELIPADPVEVFSQSLNDWISK